MAPGSSAGGVILGDVRSAAPPGYVPQETWLQDLGIAIEVIMPSLSLIFILLRAYSRIVSRNLGADDYCIFVAMVFSIAQAVVAVIYMKLAYVGIHDYEIPPHDGQKPGIFGFAAQAIYNPILSMVKISVLVFLLRFASVKPAVKYTAWALIVFTASLMVAMCIAVLFICQPLQYTWDPTVKGGHCADRTAFGASTGALNIVTDFTTLAVPFWIFLGLRMNRKAKIAILVVFGLGIIVTIVGMIRLGYLIKAWYFRKDPDFLFNLSYVISSVENNLAIIAACGPAVWPLARRWFPRLFFRLGLSHGFQGDIENIKLATASSDPSSTSSARGNRKRFSPVRPVYTNHTIGGGVIRHENTRGLGIGAQRPATESEEEILSQDGMGYTATVTRGQGKCQCGLRLDEEYRT